MELIQAELISLLTVVLTASIGFITKYIISYLDRKGIAAQIENNKKIVSIVVNAVEQAYKELDGEKKLQLAKSKLIKMMNENKIKISEDDLDLMIESMVKEMNDSIKKSREE